MSLSFRTFSPAFNGRDFVDFNAAPTTAESLLYRVQSHLGAFTADLSAGVSQGAAGQTQTITGTPSTAVLGKEVVVTCSSSDRGTLVIEDSSDGITWGNAASFPVGGGDTIGVRFTPSLTRYRCSFTVAGGGSVKKVTVISQVRNPGV